MTHRIHVLAIVLLGLVIALGLVFFPNVFHLARLSFAEGVASASPSWLEKTGSGWTAPACGSAVPSITCVGSVPQATVSWSYNAAVHGAGDCYVETLINGGSAVTYYGGACLNGSRTFNNLTPSTTYRVDLNFAIDTSTCDAERCYPSSRPDPRWITFTTPSCIPPDLTATLPMPVTVVAGEQFTLRGFVENRSATAVNATFSDIFQIQNVNTGNWDNVWPTSAVVHTIPATIGAQEVTFTTTAALGWAGSVFQIRFCADHSGGVAESNEANNCSTPQALIITPPGQADLTATMPSSVTVTAGQQFTLSGFVKNLSPIAVNETFIDMFQLWNAGAGTWDSVWGTNWTAHNLPAVTGSQEATFTTTAALSWAGSVFQVRFCADSSSTVVEASDANNCSAPQTLTVNPVSGGGGGTPECRNGADDDGDALSDHPNDPGCSNPDDDDETNTPPALPAAVIDINAIPRIVNPGDNTTLTWDTQNATSCTISWPGGNYSIPLAQLNVGTQQQDFGPVTQSTTYTLSCVGTNGATVTDSVLVRINPNFIEE